MIESSTSRFFVALRPDPRAAARLGRLAAALAVSCRGRPLAPRDLHLTLAFVGELPASEGEHLAKLLAGLPEHHPGFALDQIGCFGPALLWAGPGRTPSWLGVLVEAVQGRLQAGGIGFDRRPFKAHLTLVRSARDRQAVESAAAQAKRTATVSDWRLVVGGSHPAPEPGRRYLWRRLHTDPAPADRHEDR